VRLGRLDDDVGEPARDGDDAGAATAAVLGDDVDPGSSNAGSSSTIIPDTGSAIASEGVRRNSGTAGTGMTESSGPG
jgi:hypothetical protein